MLAGLAWSIAIYHFVVRALACGSRRKYASEARSAAQKQLGSFEPGQAVAVGFAPGPTPRYFVTGYNWDHGVLFFTPQKLVFAGEHVGFALTRDQIRIIVPADGGPGWMKSTRVYFAWLDKKTGRYGTFNLAVLDQKSWFSHLTEARVLYQRINAWRNRVPDRGEFSLTTELGPPDVGAVTSMSPKELNKFSRSINLSIVIVGLAWGVATLFALPFGWYIAASALLIRLYESLPYWRYHERAYVSDPVVAAPRAMPPPTPLPPVERPTAVAQ